MSRHHFSDTGVFLGAGGLIPPEPVSESGRSSQITQAWPWVGEYARP